ncbi:SMI1/KNR4 family protein [Kroppenstedtia eburnea]|uniref:SMI1/KNR4 family protein n=1 Tax=Kroppenstedtia eburnea TaxID=714067 RepID=UPI0036253770
MERITWEGSEDTVDDDVIEEIEKKLGIKFPLDYIDVVKQYHGATPDPSKFDYGDERRSGYFDRLLSFNPEEYESVQRLSLDFVKDEDTPANIIPFGMDAAGNLLCFDYKTSNSAPSVVYWLHEENKLAPISESFTHLLDRLY